MTKNHMSRRRVLAAGGCALLAAAGIPSTPSAAAAACLTRKNEDTVRRYYSAWEQKDWHPFEVLLADDFTFTSPNNDDHISKSTFKVRCWETQINFIQRFELQRLIGDGNEAFVRYVCRTTNGKSFRNVEMLRLKDNQVEAIECYFGSPSSFASAVSTGQA